MAIELGDAIWRIGGDARGLLRTLRGSTRAIAAAGTAAAASVLAFTKSSVSEYANLGDEIGKLAKRTGMSTEELSRLRTAAELSDTSLEGLGKGMKNVADLMEDAADGGKTQNLVLQKLGINLKDIQGMHPDKIFDTFAQALMKVENPTRRAALAADVFGSKVGNQLLPMLHGGAEALQEMKDATKKVFTKKDTDEAEGYLDAIRLLKEVYDALRFTIAEAMLPVFKKFVDKGTQILEMALAWRDSNRALVDSVIRMTVGFSALVALLAPGVLAATLGLISAKAVILIGGLAALAVGIYNLIGGWATIEKVMYTVGEVIANARVWLLENWEQITRIFESGKNAVFATLEIFWLGLRTVFQAVVAMLGGAAQGYADEFGVMDRQTGASTTSILDQIEHMVKRAEQLLTGLALTVRQKVAEIQAYWAPMRAFFAEFASFSMTRGPVADANRIAGWMGFAPQGLATGGHVTAPGWAMVGERGPELVNLPGGSTVYDAQQTAAATQAGGGPLTINFGRDSVRSNDDIRQIETSLTRMFEGGLMAAGMRV